MAADPALSMLFDVCRELVEMTKEAGIRAQAGDDYEKGRRFGLFEAVALLSQQADSFEIDRAKIGLADLDPERDLLGP